MGTKHKKSWHIGMVDMATRHTPPAPGSYYGSLRLSDELKQEEDFLGARRQLYGDLRTAEAAEAQAAEKLFQDQRNAEVRTAEAAEQSRRAATAEQIHARAMEEYRLRDAEAKAAAAAAADAKALFERAAEAARRAEEARNAEVAAAEKKATEARTAEQTLSQIRCHRAEHRCHPVAPG